MDQARIRSLLILCALWLAIYFAGIFSPALLDDADTVHAEAAKEMLLRHDWVTLYANGIRYLEKAPFMYWSVAASYGLLGVSEWTTRLPLVLGVLALVLVTYGIGRHCFGERGGFYSGLALVTSLGPYLFTRFLIPDVLVGLWLAWSVYCFLCTLEQKVPSRWACWGMAATAALNVLTKGLIGIVFPIGIFGAYLLLTGRLRHIWRLRMVSSALVFLLIAAPWHVLAALRNPAAGSSRGFLWFYFINEHVLRYLGKRFPKDYDTVPFLIFWGLLLLWLIPWTTFFPEALREVPLKWRTWQGEMTQRQRANFLFFLWAVIILVFFSFSTRQEYYTIPALPALALLVGGWLQKEEDSAAESPARRSALKSSLVLFVMGLTGFVVAMIFLANAKTPAPGTDLADLLRKNPQDYALSFGHFFDLTGPALGAFRVPLAGFGFCLLAGTGLNWYLRRRGATRNANYALALMMVGLLTCVHAAFVTFNPVLSSKKVAEVIQREYKPGDAIVVLGKYEHASSLNFYTGLRLLSVHEPTGNMWYGSLFPDAPPVWLTVKGLHELWNGPGRVFVWAEHEEPTEMEGLPRYAIFRSGGKILFVNRK